MGCNSFGGDPPTRGTHPNAGTQAYLDAFRIMATPREQAWIRELNTGYPQGFNLEVHEGNPLTRERREKRTQSNLQTEWQKVPRKGRSDVQGFNAPPEPPWWLDGSRLHFSGRLGPDSRVRKFWQTMCDWILKRKEQPFVQATAVEERPNYQLVDKK